LEEHRSAFIIVKLATRVERARESGGGGMGQSQRDLKSWTGLLIVGLVILLFLALVTCQADFFTDFSVTF
jgi:multisubunit Na+/H+ antiporter MnhB subunit